MSTLTPRTVINPLTGKQMTLTPDQQWRLFEKGIILDTPFESDTSGSPSSSVASHKPDQHV